MTKPIWVVIDKDFLQSASNQSALGGIIDQGFRILLTGRTAYEICTTEKSGVKTKCLRMLESFKDNVDIINEDGKDGLLGYEISQGISSGAVLHENVGSLPMNLSKFLQDNGQFWQEWARHFEIDPAKYFPNVAFEITKSSPALKKEDLKNPETIRTIYRSLTNQNRKGLPPPESIDEHWIIFRILQVDCWAALHRAQVNDKNMLHDRVDSRIAALGLLTKGLATNERWIRELFGYFCPEGRLFSNG